MSAIEKVSTSISNKLGNMLNKSQEEKNVLNYGLFVVLHTSLGILVTLLVGIITGYITEMAVISIVISWLKRYSGGVHASTPESCMIIGVTLAFGLSVFSRYLSEGINSEILGFILVIDLSICYYILYKKCPVPSKNKPLKKESTRKKLRKRAFRLIIVYTVVIISLYIIYNVSSIYIAKKIIISILLGIDLQIFVLTSIGNRFIQLLDSMFNIFL